MLSFYSLYHWEVFWKDLFIYITINYQKFSFCGKLDFFFFGDSMDWDGLLAPFFHSTVAYIKLFWVKKIIHRQGKPLLPVCQFILWFHLGYYGPRSVYKAIPGALVLPAHQNLKQVQS